MYARNEIKIDRFLWKGVLFFLNDKNGTALCAHTAALLFCNGIVGVISTRLAE